METKTRESYLIIRNRVRNIHNIALCICEWADNNENCALNYTKFVEVQTFYEKIKRLAEENRIEIKEV